MKRKLKNVYWDFETHKVVWLREKENKGVIRNMKDFEELVIELQDFLIKEFDCKTEQWRSVRTYEVSNLYITLQDGRMYNILLNDVTDMFIRLVWHKKDIFEYYKEEIYNKLIYDPQVFAETMMENMDRPEKKGWTKHNKK